MNEQDNTNLDSQTAQEILAKANVQALKDQAYRYIDNSDWDAALDLARKLEAKFRQFTPANRDEQHWHGIVRYWMLRLKLFAFANLNPTERHELLQKHALEIVRNGIDLKSYLFDYIDFYQTSEIILQETNDFIVALKNNQEVLGDNRAAFKQQNFFPGVGNWITQYQPSLNKHKLGKAKPGAFELTDFFNSNQYVRHLSVQEKNILKSILSLYNWLISPIVFVESTPPGYVATQRVTALEPKKPVVLPPIAPRPAIAGFSPRPQTISTSAVGLSIDKLKSELKQSPPALSALEKKYAAPVVARPTPKPLLTPDEIKREVRTPELPAHALATPSLSPSPQGGGKQQSVTPAAVDDIKFVDDLKKISANHLRRGNLAMETEKIKAKIAYLAAVNRLFPHEVVAVFEQSPLFKLYLKIGGMLIADRSPDRRAAFDEITAKLKADKQDTLTLQEFESVADLKKEIERM